MKQKNKWKCVWEDGSQLEFETSEEALLHFESADKGTRLYMKVGKRWQLLGRKQKGM